MAERVADADRDRTVTQLREHVVEGRLTLDEFSERVGSGPRRPGPGAISVAVMADLPQARRPAGSCPSPPRPPRPRRSGRWHIAVMSGHSTKGRWRISGKTNAVAVMGGCDMDLRRAEIEGPEVEITAVAFWGGINIVVPEGFDVELRGFSFMGGRDLKLRDVPDRAGLAPDRGAGLRRHGWHRRQEPPEPVGQAAGPRARHSRDQLKAADAVADARRHWPRSRRTSGPSSRPTAPSPSSSATWSTTPA